MAKKTYEELQANWLLKNPDVKEGEIIYVVKSWLKLTDIQRGNVGWRPMYTEIMDLSIGYPSVIEEIHPESGFLLKCFNEQLTQRYWYPYNILSKSCGLYLILPNGEKIKVKNFKETDAIASKLLLTLKKGDELYIVSGGRKQDLINRYNMFLGGTIRDLIDTVYLL